MIRDGWDRLGSLMVLIVLNVFVGDGLGMVRVVGMGGTCSAVVDSFD